MCDFPPPPKKQTNTKSSVLEGVQREEEGEMGEVQVGVRDERGRLRQHQL